MLKAIAAAAAAAAVGQQCYFVNPTVAADGYSECCFAGSLAAVAVADAAAGDWKCYSAGLTTFAAAVACH